MHFAVDGTWQQRALRCLVGFGLVLAVYLGLKVLFQPLSQGTYLAEQALRWIRYGAVGFTITGLAPWLFGKLRLT